MIWIRVQIVLHSSASAEEFGTRLGTRVERQRLLTEAHPLLLTPFSRDPESVREQSVGRDELTGTKLAGEGGGDGAEQIPVIFGQWDSAVLSAENGELVT